MTVVGTSSNYVEARSADYQQFRERAVDIEALRAYRLGRVQQLLRENDCDAALLTNPVNIRYATNTRNMTVWTLHNIARYCVVPAQGRPVLFEFPNYNCLENAAGAPGLREVRLATLHSFSDAGRNAETVSRRWAAEIAGLVREMTGRSGRRLGVDRLDILGIRALEREGFVP